MSKNLKSFLFAAAICFMLPGLAGNLLKNSDFSDLTGAQLPRNWEIRGQVSLAAAGKGSLTLGGDASKHILVIQRHLPVKAGISYTMSWYAAGKASYRCYVEYVYMDNGKKKLRSQHTAVLKPVAAGSKMRFTFSVPASAVQTYVAFSVKSAEKVTVSRLSLQETDELKRNAGLLPNSDFSELNSKGQPVDWKCTGKAENYRFTPGKAEVKGKNYLIGNLNNAIGKNAVFTCRIAGNGKYRIYAEWYWRKDNKPFSRATLPHWHNAVPDGKDFTLKLAIPDYAKTAILAIQTDSADGITYSDLSVTEPNIHNFTLAPKGTKTIALPELVPGKKYQIVYQVRGTGSTGNTTSFHFFKMELRSGGKKLAAFPEEDCMAVFQNKTAVFTAPDRNKLELKIDSQSAGQLEFRDLTTAPVTEKIPDERLVITSPRFRNTFYSSIPEKTVSGQVISRRKVSGGTAALKTASGKIHTCKLEEAGPVWKFDLPGEPGELSLTLALPDGGKTVLKETIGKLPPAPMEVITGPGRSLYINGKPFFSVMFYFYGNNYASARNGINTVMINHPTNPADLLKRLDEADKYQIKVIVSFMSTIRTRTYDAEKLRAWQHMAENLLTKEVLAHPAFLGYYLADEPFWCGVNIDSLRRNYEILKTIDPYHPVWICAAPRGTVEQQRPYARCADVYGLDIYPVPVPNSHSHIEDKTLSCVGKYTLRMAEVTDHVKPIYMTIQGFSWQDLKKNGTITDYPNLDESRFMTYDAIINGSTGLCWYGVRSVRSPEFLEDLLKVTRELQKISGVLSAPDSVTGKVSEVEFRRFYGPGWSFAIAANTANRKVEVTLSGIPGLKDGKQIFKPYEVKFYPHGRIPAPAWNIPPQEKERGDDILPFTGPLKQRLQSVEYTPPPNMKWIWGEKEKSIRKSRIFARLRFTAEPNLKNASLRFAADDFVAGIFLDGKKIESSAPFHGSTRYLNQLSFSNPIRPGEHILMLEAGDSGMLPCGLLAELRLEYADGKVVSIPTNSAWETATKPSGPWQKAAEIKKIGERPWGMPKLMPPIPSKP